jgi:hypothetical protein
VIAMPIFFAGGFAVLMILPVVLVLGILVILALRHDDDPDGNRAPAMYASVIAFLAILTILFATTGVVSELMEITSGHTHASGSYGYSETETFGVDGSGRRLTRSYSDDDDGAAVTHAMAFFIAGVAALVLLRIHSKLFARRFTVTGAAARVHRAYLLVMCFAVALIGMAASGMALFELYQVIFKDAANIESRADELRDFVPAAVLAIGAWSIWTWHWRELDLDGSAPPPTATATTVP